MNLETGKLYRINQCFWYLFPTKEAAATAVGVAPGAGRSAMAQRATWATYWSNQLNCNVSFLKEGDILFVIETSGTQVKVINQDGLSGWMNFPADELCADESWKTTVFLIHLTPAAGSANMQA